jgi:hypothetical protein
MDLIKRLGIKAIIVTLCIILVPLYAFGEQKGPISPSRSFEKQVMTIIEKPVKVTMKLIDQYNNDYQFELSVVYGKDKFKFENEMVFIKDLNQAISQQRSRTGWKGPYLFIGQGCDTLGNAARLCLDLVFTIRDGKLVYIGEALAGEADEPGSSYEKGVFRDIYDKFEINDLTSHAEAPLFWLVLEEKDGRFRVNLRRTWEANRTEFYENVKTLRSAGEILFNAVLAKYCQQKVELEQMVQAAKSKLDKEELQTFLDILSQVVPGELPERSVDVSREKLSENSEDVMSRVFLSKLATTFQFEFTIQDLIPLLRVMHGTT